MSDQNSSTSDKYERAEQIILGNILLFDNELMAQCSSLRSDYFTKSFYRQAFVAMRTLYAAGKLIDEVSLMDELNTKNQANVHDHMWAFDALTEGVVQRKDLSYHVGLIRDGYRQRHTSMMCDDLSKQIDEGECTDSAEITARLQNAMERISAPDNLEASHHFQEIGSVVWARKLALRESGTGLVGYTTSIPAIDRMTTGIRDGEYWVIGGAPSRGKTVFAAQIVSANADAGVACLVFSLEMSREQFFDRMTPYYSGVGAGLVRDCRLASQEQMAAIQQGVQTIQQLPVIAVDPDTITAAQITAIAKLHIRNHGVRLVVVDHLQIVRGDGDTRREVVSAISDSLRSLAKQENVAVIGLSQLRRPADESERPSMFQLKESGDVEGHAHTVLLVYRPKNENGEWTGRDEIIIAKQREGLVGTELVELDQRKLRFLPRDPHEQGRPQPERYPYRED